MPKGLAELKPGELVHFEEPGSEVQRSVVYTGTKQFNLDTRKISGLFLVVNSDNPLEVGEIIVIEDEVEDVAETLREISPQMFDTTINNLPEFCPRLNPLQI